MKSKHGTECIRLNYTNIFVCYIRVKENMRPRINVFYINEKIAYVTTLRRINYFIGLNTCLLINNSLRTLTKLLVT